MGTANRSGSDVRTTILVGNDAVAAETEADVVRKENEVGGAN
jgi:hypothetical protein